MAHTILSVNDLSTAELLQITDPCGAHEAFSTPLRGTLAMLFQQPSLRTMSSFARAGAALGLAPVAINGMGDALRDQCDFEDEIVQLGLTSNCVVVRSRAALSASAFSKMYAPLVSAGDGSNEHPTQALVDIASMRAEGGLEGKTVTLAGNLRDHRVAHSLVRAFGMLGANVQLLSPADCQLPAVHLAHCPSAKEFTAFSVDEADEVLCRTDYFYQVPLKYWNTPNAGGEHIFGMSLERAEKVLRTGAKVFHPFPRFEELARNLDHTPFDAYHAQTARGPLVRRRLLTMLLE